MFNFTRRPNSRLATSVRVKEGRTNDGIVVRVTELDNDKVQEHVYLEKTTCNEKPDTIND